jgi:hypothetical protein
MIVVIFPRLTRFFRSARMSPRVRPFGLSIRSIPALAFAMCLTLALLISACDSGGSSKKKKSSDGDGNDITPIDSAPYTKTFVLSPIEQDVDSVAVVEADVPKTSLAMGIVTSGILEDNKLIVHGFQIEDPGSVRFITDPNGDRAPLSYSLDENGDPIPYTTNIQATAVLFPNDGQSATLDLGTWSIPVATVNAAFTDFEPDHMTTIVYYKTKTNTRPTLKLNVWVVSGVGVGISDNATAAADPEIQGAIGVLQNVYERNDSTDINIDVNVQFITPVFDGTPDVINSDAEIFALAQDFPASPDHESMNIFVLSNLSFLGDGVIGYALGLPGPFTRQGTAVSGTLAEYQSDEENPDVSSGDVGVTLGYILAHEFGHFLGLYHSSQTNDSQTGIVGHDPISDTADCSTADIQHEGSIDGCPDRFNLMFPVVCDVRSEDNCDNPEVSQGQGNVVRYNPGVTP